MNLPDTNILINAFRPETLHHEKARAWLTDALNDGSPVRLFPTVETGFLRIVTNSRIFEPPSLFSEASGFLQTLAACPSVEIVQWSKACRDRWLALCADLNLCGNDCNEAMLASVALEKNLRMVTFDQGFRRFPNLELLLLKDE